MLVALAHAEAESTTGNIAALALVPPRFSLPPDADDEVDDTLDFESECMKIWSLRWRSGTRGEGRVGLWPKIMAMGVVHVQV